MPAPSNGDFRAAAIKPEYHRPEALGIEVTADIRARCHRFLHRAGEDIRQRNFDSDQTNRRPRLFNYIMTYRNPFPVPESLTPKLQSVVSYWRGLERAENAMPFSDDIDLSILPHLSNRIFILSVFALPERFRLEFMGKELQGSAEARMGGFLDELRLGGDFSYLRAQSSATAEATAPTFWRLAVDSDRGFSRLPLPMWGSGQISMLLGAVDSN